MSKIMAAKHSLIKRGKGKRQWAVWFTFDDHSRSTLHRLKLNGKALLEGATQQEIADATLQLTQDLIKGGGYVASGKSHFKNFEIAANAYFDWYKDHRAANLSKIKFHNKMLINEFAEYKMYAIGKPNVRAFADKLVQKKYSKVTIKNILTAGSAIYTWAIDKEYFVGVNPFTRAMKYVESEHGSNLVIPPPPIKTITDYELSLLWGALQSDERKAARIFMYVALHTGLRPSEIYGLKIEQFTHNTLTYYRTKTKPQWRTIYIPVCLWVFLKNNCPETGRILPCGFSGVRFQMREACKESGVVIYPKTPRKVFANKMKDVGAEFWKINLHQGREFSSVLEQNYLDLDPIRECQKYIDIMFESENKFAVSAQDSALQKIV